ncbi:hypothetical protein E1091_02325 [Micromonospora fluostatini]|uniref:Uncharacterized protein n=1 Tax=Micromonospora fluostatini TaxID=1629071 RepID=A0ABY2DL09_9ACTN|nr:hypothetical protein E1091_02325 [Micromonospora fluostatini]
MAAPTLHPRYVAPRGGLPRGVKMSNLWKDASGVIVPHPTEVPVDQETFLPTGTLWVCLKSDGEQTCPTVAWTFGEDDVPSPRCCADHPVELVPVEVFARDTNPVAGGRARAAEAVRMVIDRRRQAAIDAARAKVEALRDGAQGQARKAHADLKDHIPSAGAGLGVLGAGLTVVSLDNAALEWALGIGLATAGAVAAYAVAYLVGRMRPPRKGKSEVGRDRRARTVALRYAVASLSSGAWLAAAGAANATLDTPQGCVALAFGLLFVWAVCRTYWKELSDRRDRLRDMVRRRAEEEARKELERLAAEQAAAEEARRQAEEARLAAERAQETAVVEEVATPATPEAMGEWMAAEWRRISGLATVPGSLKQVLPHTRILPKLTRRLTSYVEGETVHIGWEFMVDAAPGALVPLAGQEASPLAYAKGWIADVMNKAPYLVTVVDRPDNKPNRAVLIVSDEAPLGETVHWKGKAGIRIAPNGAMYGHMGRTLLGDDVEEVLYVPGQAGGSSTFGVTGSGKSVNGQIAILNRLATGRILPVLHDPKMFMDYLELVGVIPMGCTQEHREVIWRSLDMERQRRQKYLSTLRTTDRHGREGRPVEPVWDVERDGPVLWALWEEFHEQAADEKFIKRLLYTVRLQRATAIHQAIATQSGGLADMGDSVLRDQINMIAMKLARMSDHSALMTGYKGPYRPSGLPRLPGAMLYICGDADPIPMRGAFVTRKDVEGSLYDQLYSPSGELLLPAPTLPDATIEVFKREGLWDVWEMGKGPNGLDKLLADAERIATTVDTTSATVTGGTKVVATGPQVHAKDVLMALIATKPGSSRGDVAEHPMWQERAGWDKYPHPSAITSALSALEREAMITRRDGIYHPTPKGSARGQQVLEQLAARVAGPSAHDERLAAERAAERQLEDQMAEA